MQSRQVSRLMLVLLLAICISVASSENISLNESYIDIDLIINLSINQDYLETILPDCEITVNETFTRISKQANTIILNDPNVSQITDFKLLDMGFATKVIAANSFDFDDAHVVLKKDQDIARILYCPDFNIATGDCTEWVDQGAPFSQNSTHVWFNIDHFSGYAGEGNETNQTLKNSSLEIWYDPVNLFIGNTTTIYAEYNDTELIDGECRLEINSLEIELVKDEDYYSGNYTFTTAGSFPYIVRCHADGYLNQTKSSIISVNNLTIIDADEDGYNYSVDCDDTNPNINPGKSEILYNYIDDDCNAQTQDYLSLDITCDKQTYEIGETSTIVANSQPGSDTYLTVHTPVNISYVYIFSGPYPIIQLFEFTNTSGLFSIEGIAYYQNYTITKNANFQVKNSMTLNLGHDNSGYINEILEFSASAAGGTGNYVYEWDMGDTTTKSGSEITHSYSSSGEFNVVIKASDNSDNYIVDTFSVRIEPKYYLRIQVRDSSGPIKNALVELDSRDEFTNVSGMVQFIVTNKTYDLDIIVSDHEPYSSQVKVNSSHNLLIMLKDTEIPMPPVIALNSPNDKENVHDAVSFEFSTDDDANCTIYISDGSGWWEPIGSVKGSEDFEKDLEPGEYKWKVECINKYGLSKFSQERSFTVSEKEEEDLDTFGIVEEAYGLLPDYKSYGPDQKKIVALLNLENIIRDTKEKLDRANADLHNLKYGTNAEAIIQARNDILQRIETLKDMSPIAVDIEKKVNYVKYIEDEEAAKLIEDYYSAKAMEVSGNEKKNFIEENTKFQKRISVSTEAFNVKLKYYSGREVPITLIYKTVEFNPIFNDIRIVEFIPKDIAETASEITMISKALKVIEPDPILEMEPGEDIAYYINKRIDLDMIPKIKTIVVGLDAIEKSSGIGSVTGLTFLSSNRKKFIFVIEIIIIAVLIGIYAKISSGSEKKLPESKLPMVEGIINEACSLLAQKKLQAAALKYEELTMLFRTLNAYEQDQCRKQISTIAADINYAYLTTKVDQIFVLIANNQHEQAIALYEEIGTEYENLPEHYKEQLYPKCCEAITMLNEA